MRQRAEVIIIGGGVIGCSIAYHLGRKGCRDVILLERESLGSGSTGRCAGGIRLQFSTEINIHLSLLSVPAFENFADEMGYEPDFRQVGYLILAVAPEEMEAFRENVALQQRLGVPVRLLTGTEAQKMVPQLNIEDVLGATFCPRDGHADPHGVTQGYAHRARELGVQIYEGTEVRGIQVEKDRVKGVLTDKGPIEAQYVVNAAGPYAALVAAMAGVKIPVLPYRRYIFVTEPFPDLPDPLPMVIDFATGFYFHRESGGLLMGMGDRSEPSSFNLEVDWGFLPTLVERAIYRAPVLEKAQIKRGWAGLYEVTPDAHPILGRVPEVEGFILANGFSGHGFMHAPAVGLLIAEEVLDGKASTLDISPLTLDRFREGRAVPERSVI